MALPEPRRFAAETETVLRAELDPTQVLFALATAMTLVSSAVEQTGQRGK
jgi:hypothetical protein